MYHARENVIKSRFALMSIYTQKEIAQRMGYSENAIVAMFKGRPVHRHTAMRIAEILDCPIDELFEVRARKERAPKAPALTPETALEMALP